MNKNKTAFVCNSCGQDYAKWRGKCDNCGEWDTITEIRIASKKDSGFRLHDSGDPPIPPSSRLLLTILHG